MPSVRSEKQLVELRFPGGINNIVREDAMPLDVNGNMIFCRDANNVDFHENGDFNRRDGYVQRAALTAGSSLFSDPSFPYMLARKEDKLIAFDHMLNQTVLATGLGNGNASYVYIDGEVRWTVEDRATGVLTANLDAYPMGLAGPRVASLTDVAGTMRPGKYQVALSFKMSNGEEGGVGRPSVIDVVSGGIAVAIPNHDAPVTHVRVWATRTNGTILEHVKDVPIGITSYVINDDPRGRDADAKYLVPMPKGHIIRVIDGFTLMAYKNQLWYSPPFRPHLCDGRNGFVTFADRIDVLENCGGADSATTFVAAGNKVYKMTGTNPTNWTQRWADMAHGAVPGTGMQVPADVFLPDAPDGSSCAYWLGRDGIPRAGFGTGLVTKLTDKSVAMTIFDKGSTLLREIEGRRLLITTGNGGGRSSLAYRDSAEVAVYRNGILLD